MQVKITRDWHQHREGTVEECTPGVADLLINVLKIATPHKPQRPTKAKEKAPEANGAAV